MSKILKVTIEFEDKILSLEGEEAVKWDKHNVSLALGASNRVGNQNPFDTDPVKWTETPRIQFKNLKFSDL